MPHASDYPAVHGSLLVVEDDDELAGLLQDVLNMSGYDVVLAGSNADALACLSSERRIEAAILDLSVTDGTTLPVAPTPTARGPAARAIDRNSVSTEGRYRFTGGSSVTRSW